MKREFDLYTVTTYSLFYCQIFKCNIANHKTLQEYSGSDTKARNKLVELENSLSELAVIFAFLNGFDISYQAWKDMYLKSYSKNGVDKNGKIIIPRIEEIFKLLLVWESGIKVSAVSKTTTQAFKTF